MDKLFFIIAFSWELLKSFVRALFVWRGEQDEERRQREYAELKKAKRKRGSKMAKYRKRPVVIDAVQWHIGDALPEGCAYGHGEHFDLACCFISTLEGVMRVDDGDWVITGIKGEKYPCKPDIFFATYERVA